LHRSWYSYKLCEWHYWLSAVGVLIMASDLILAGVFQGYYRASLQPWDVSVDGSQPFWIVRVFAGLAMFGGFLCFLTNLWMTWNRAPEPSAQPSAASSNEKSAQASAQPV
jgi:cytochrome c oxidase cbb3-type subunit 1